MKYYIYTTEQIISEGEITEYSGVTKKGTIQEADVFYFDKLKNVSNAIGSTHKFMYICIKDSCGNTMRDRELTLGAYLSEVPAPTPTEVS